MDHEVRLFDFDQDFADFGPKRQLELVEVQGDNESLTLIFNQPLRLPSQGDATPFFDIEMDPPVPNLRSEFVGVAGIKITPEKALPFSTRYQVGVPSGWRAPTGAAMLRAVKKTWTTPRPAVVEVSTKSHGSSKQFEDPVLLSEGEGLRLLFNQPISRASLEQVADWREAISPGKESLPFRFHEVESPAGRDHTEYLFEPSGLQPGLDYRLTLRAGLKGLQGPLRAEREQKFLLRSPRSLEYSGPAKLAWGPGGTLELRFSTKVSVEEVERSVIAFPGRRPFQVTLLERPSSEGGSSVQLRWTEGGFPYALRILEGLTSEDGQRLEADVNLPIQERPAETTRPPLVPLSYGANDGSLGVPVDSRVVKTWRLSLREALRLSCSTPSQWAQAKAPAIGGRKPVFDSEAKNKVKEKEKASTPVAKLKPGQGAVTTSGRALAPKEPAYGYFLVSAEGRDGRRKALANRTDLVVHALTEEAGVRAEVRERATGRPLQNVKIALWTVSASGSSDLSVLGEAVTDRNGEAFLGVPKTPTGSRVRFLVASRGKDSHFVPIEERSFPPESLPPVYVTSDQAFYQPGESVRFSGFSWEGQTAIDSLLGQAVVNVDIFDLASSDAIFSSTISLDRFGTFETAWKAPSRPGLYRAEFSLTGHSDSVRRDVRVCPLSAPGDECRIEVRGEGRQRSITLTGTGVLDRSLRLRANLIPAKETPMRSGQWVPTSDLPPFWRPLTVSQGQAPESFLLTIPPGWSHGGVLIVEVFDKGHPDQILSRWVEELSGAGPRLNLEAEGQSRVGSHQTLRLVPASPETSEDSEIDWQIFHRSRGSTSPWSLLDSGTVGIPSSDALWSVRFERPGEYLLTARSPSKGGQTAEQAWELLVPAGPTLGLRPSEVYPGDRVEIQGTDRLGDGRVWLELRGGGVAHSSLREVGGAADLGSLVALPSRSREQEIRAVKLETPAWGRQRASWVEASGRLSLLSPESSQEVRMRLERGDGLEGPIRPDGIVNIHWTSDQKSVWTGFLNWRGAIPGWPLTDDDVEESYFGLAHYVPGPLRGRYPFLDPQRNTTSFVRSGLQVDGSAELSVPSPEDGGPYQARFVARDYRGRFLEVTEDFEVAQASRWRSLAPLGIRAGDRFSAGPEFLCADTEKVPVGLTIAAQRSSDLMPKTFVGTAGVVKPGASEAFLFVYELSEADVEESGSEVALEWRLGRQGLTEPRTTKVPVWRRVQVPSGQSGLSVLGTSQTQRLRVDGERPWRLDLYPPKPPPEIGNSTEAVETVVSVAGPQGGLGKVRLQPGMKPVSLQGSAPGSLHMTLLQGPSIAFRIARLQEDQGDTRAWGADIYMLRSLVDSTGSPEQSPALGATSRVVLSVVVPKTVAGAKFRIPLPGGLRPLGVRRNGSKGEEIPWTFESGTVQFDSKRLEAGEYRWELSVEAICPGDYLWPTAQAFDATGRLIALSGSERLVVQP